MKGRFRPPHVLLFFSLALLLLSGCATPAGDGESVATATHAPASAAVAASDAAPSVGVDATPVPSPEQAASTAQAAALTASPPPTVTPPSMRLPTAMPTPPPTPTVAPSATPITTFAPALPGTSQGFDLVAHHSLGGIGWHAGLALHGSCAYVGNRRSGEVAIVDVGDPASPTVAGVLSFGAAGRPVELRTVPARDLLVAADFEHARIVTFDVSDCEQPQQLGAIELPGAPHEFYLWDDGERVLLYGAMFDHADDDMIVVDVTDPAAPREAARWSSEAAGIGGLLHSLSLSPDGERAYLALWSSVLVAELDLPEVRVLRDDAGAVHPVPFAAAHSAVPLQNETPPRYLLVTSEIWVCPFADVAIVDISNPVRPQIAAALDLPESSCEDLPAPDAVFTPHNPLVVGDLVFLSWYGAGLQVLDVSDPSAPARVAQFVPAGEGAADASYIGGYPVQTWSYPILRDGLLYVVDIQSGLYVLRYTGPGAAEVAAVERIEGNVTVGE